MTFLDDVDLWPRDISGHHLFVLKAVQEIGRGLKRKDVRLPSMIYRYDFDLPKFAHASEDDKAAAADVINSNTIVGNVDYVEQHYYSEKHEKSFLIRNAQITEQQWKVAGQMIQKSRETLIENVDSAIAIASAIFQGVTGGKIVAVQRMTNQPKFMPLPAETLNIDSDAIVKARLALGQIDPNNPFDPDPRGFSYIFLETKSLEKWKNTDGNRKIRLAIARSKIMQLAANHNNRLPNALKKANLLDKERTGFILDDKEREMLWESLPDKPFKFPGVRPGEVRKR